MKGNHMETFEVSGSRIRVTDPCYTKDVWCSGILENCLSGTWNAECEVLSDEETDGWGKRVASLTITNEHYKGVFPTELTNIDVGVDSGQAGFFDEEKYPNVETLDEEFYEKVCDGTAGPFVMKEFPRSESTIKAWEKMIEQFGHDPKYDNIIAELKQLMVEPENRPVQEYLSIANLGFGVATSTGYGDGSYDCYVGRNKHGLIVSAKIVFIDPNENEEE